MHRRRQEWISRRSWIAPVLLASVWQSVLSADFSRTREPAESAQVAVRIYECAAQGQKIFSDRPCGGDALTREITAPNRMEAPPAATIAKQMKKAEGRSDDETSQRTKKIQRCEKLQADRDKLDARLRAGYSGKEGEKLRERLRQLQNDYFELRCAG